MIARCVLLGSLVLMACSSVWSVPYGGDGYGGDGYGGDSYGGDSYGGSDCEDYGYSPVCTKKYRTFPNHCYYEKYNSGGYGDQHEYSHDGQCYEHGHPSYHDQYPQDEYSSNYKSTYKDDYESDTKIIIVESPPAPAYQPAYQQQVYAPPPAPPAPAPAPMMMVMGMPPAAPVAPAPVVMPMPMMGKKK